MAKHPRPTHADQSAPEVAPPPEQESPSPAPEDDVQSPAWGWTIALVVWFLCFSGLAIYELWTGMLMKLFWRG